MGCDEEGFGARGRNWERRKRPISARLMKFHANLNVKKLFAGLCEVW
jgi:hypothetical protein